LQKHPSLEIVSRDGSSEYASAIKKGAPQARQVSDRWHLVKNLAECVSVQLAQSLAQLRRAETAAAGRNEQVEEEPSTLRPPAQTRAIAQAQVARQAEQMDRYEHLLQLQQQGMKNAEIALQLGVTPRTIQRWLATGTIPSSRPRRQRARLLDPYHSYIMERYKQGCRNGAQLERELRAKGDIGSQHGVSRYLQTLKASTAAPCKHTPASELASSIQPNVLLTLSASEASLSLFSEGRGFKATRAGDPSTVEAGQPSPRSHLPTGRRISAHGT
jgi:transposase